METSMANTKEIQKRMKSIKDTMKITNAMYMISSSKLRNAKQRLEDTEPIRCSRHSSVFFVIRLIWKAFISAIRSIFPYRKRKSVTLW